METKVGKQSNIFGPLFRLGQLGKDEESLPSFAGIGQADTFEADGQIVEKAFRNGTSPHHAQGSKLFKAQVDPRCNDTSGKDPLGDIQRDDGLDLTGPFVKGEQIDGGKGIDGIDGGGNDQRDPEIAVC